MNLIDKHIINRSSRAIKCLFFNADFYKKVQVSGLNAKNVFDEKEKYILGFSSRLKDTNKIEDTFLKLIKIGLLRREVDGQGLTSKVRLTPLGRLIIEKEPNLANQNASLFELFSNWMLMNLILK